MRVPYTPRPTLDLIFNRNEVLDSRLIASGGANGTRINSAGNIVAATCPRFDYNPTTLVSQGLLIEQARTNLLLNSAISGTSLTTQNVTVTAVPHTLTFYGTGSITLTGASTAGPLSNPGAYPNRGTLTFTPTAGTLTLTVAGSVQYAQLEVGAFASTFIPTDGSAKTRAADVCQITNMTWFNRNFGTYAAEYESVASVDQRILRVSDGTSSFDIRKNASPQSILNIRDSASNNRDVGVTAPVGRNIKGAYAWQTGSGNITAQQSLDNGANVQSIAGVWVSTGAVLTAYVGNSTGGLNGRVQRIRYWPTPLSRQQLSNLTR